MHVKHPKDHALSEMEGDGIIANIRHMDISGNESPYLTANIHFSGQCVVNCRDCHSNALFRTALDDKRNIQDVLGWIKDQYKLGLIQGICILGTDTVEKERALPPLYAFAKYHELLTIVYTGYVLSKAIWSYGVPDWYICGPYVGGEWYQGKTFYKYVSEQGGFYRNVPREEYFIPEIINKGEAHGRQTQPRSEI